MKHQKNPWSSNMRKKDGGHVSEECGECRREQKEEEADVHGPDDRIAEDIADDYHRPRSPVTGYRHGHQHDDGRGGPYGCSHRDETLRALLGGDGIGQYRTGGGCDPGEPPCEHTGDHPLDPGDGTDGVFAVVVLDLYHRIAEGLEHHGHTEQSCEHREHQGASDDDAVTWYPEVHTYKTQQSGNDDYEDAPRDILRFLLVQHHEHHHCDEDDRRDAVEIV